MIELTDDLPGTAAQFVIGAFEIVEFLDHRHRQYYVIIAKRVDRLRIVEQDIGIEDKMFRTFHKSSQVMSLLRFSQPSSWTTTMFSSRMPPQPGI